MTQNLDVTREQLHTCLLYEFRLGTTAGESHQRLCQAFGKTVISLRTCHDWFSRFRSGDYSIEDKPRSGRPSEVDDHALRQLVEANPRLTSREMVATLGCSHSTIENHLSKIGKVSKLGSWVPHVLLQKDLDQRCDACLFLLSRRRHFQWLDSVVTGDEKWVLYANHTRKRQWVSIKEKPQPEPKGDLHPRQEMLSVWWDAKGVVYFELLPHHVTITAAYYCSQLQRLNEELSKVRPGQDKILFLHDNARPHSAKLTRLQLLEFGWELLPHPPYSPDLAPSDYHLFRALQIDLRDRHFDDRRELESYLQHFFTSKPQSFYREGIHALPARWRQVVDHNGQYIHD